MPPPKTFFSSPESANRAFTLSRSVLFSLSAVPSCSGHLGTVVSCFIPLSMRKFSKFVEQYSPPLSVLNIFIDFPVSFSTVTLEH